jgi:hypothetical protein
MSAVMPSTATVVVLGGPQRGSTASGSVVSKPVSGQERPTTCIVKQVPQKKKQVVVKKTVKKKNAVKSPAVTPQKTKVKPKLIPEKPVKKAQPKTLSQPNKNIEKIAAPEPAQSAGQTQAAEAIENLPGCEAIAIAYADARLMHQYMALQNELSKYWAPPPGMADDCKCQLTACIDRTGVVSDVMVQESSGVLIFDITARSALLAVAWPVWSWGSSITITFKP